MARLYPRADPGWHRAAAADVTPAALASTFVTSATGMITFAIPAIHQSLLAANLTSSREVLVPRSFSCYEAARQEAVPGARRSRRSNA